MFLCPCNSETRNAVSFRFVLSAVFGCMCFLEQKKVLKAARIVAGILNEPFGARFEADALEPWQQRVLVDLRLDGPGADLTVHLGGDSTRGRLPVRQAKN